MSPPLSAYHHHLDFAREKYDLLFVDNVFPCFAKDLSVPAKGVSSSFVEKNSELSELWRETLRSAGQQIQIPREIYCQAMRGYGAMTKAISHEKGHLSSELEQSLKHYQQGSYHLLQELQKHVFAYSALESQTINAYVTIMKELDQQYHLKKIGHKDDGHADEVLVASAIYTSEQKGKYAVIITHDSDIDRLAAQYHICKRQGNLPKGNIDISDVAAKVEVYHLPQMNCQTKYTEIQKSSISLPTAA